MLRKLSLRGKPAIQKLGEASIVNRFGKMFDALLIAPRVIDNEASLPLAEVNVGVVQVDGVRNACALSVIQLRVRNDFVLCCRAQDRV